MSDKSYSDYCDAGMPYGKQGFIKWIHEQYEAELAKSRQREAEERAIVDRIWDLFGRPSYERLNGKSIYDLISELQQERDKLQAENESIGQLMKKWQLEYGQLTADLKTALEALEKYAEKYS